MVALILHMTFQGQTHQMQAGVMVDLKACMIAGAGMGMILEAANPGLTVTWTCAPVGEAA